MHLFYHPSDTDFAKNRRVATCRPWNMAMKKSGKINRDIMAPKNRPSIGARRDPSSRTPQDEVQRCGCVSRLRKAIPATCPLVGMVFDPLPLANPANRESKLRSAYPKNSTIHGGVIACDLMNVERGGSNFRDVFRRFMEGENPLARGLQNGGFFEERGFHR